MMTKRLIFTFLAAFVMMAAMAIPAKPGLWQTMKLSSGTEVTVQLMGDEHLHYWMSKDGQCYVEQGDELIPIERNALRAKAMNRRARLAPLPASLSVGGLRGPRKVEIGERTHYMGKKKGLVLLVEFSDVKFKATNDLEKYKKILNQENYREGNFRGSVADYFKAQSGGLFELDFDVLGPYMLANNQKYYGQNDSQGDDLHPEEMVIEACQMANGTIDFADYDWDGDGEVDQVFVLYAGKGEADGGGKNTIWPHMYTFDEAGAKLTLDGIKINTYACSNEIDPSGNIEGIGAFCHEFSHCLGFPDFYDITYSGQFGMGQFDIMSGGSYNGSGFVPCGYTAHEKMMCGWMEPIVLGDEDVEVDNLQPMSNNGNTYIIYNDAYPSEYYMIENRQKTGWDANYPAKGLLITHVDFDKEVWENNIPNTVLTNREALELGLTCGNDHQRMTLFHADNADDASYFNSSWGGYTRTTVSTDLYPYHSNDSLTATSKPAAKLFNADSRGRKLMQGAILDIRQNANGTMGFRYRAKSPEIEPADTTQTESGVLFYESFALCGGTGGNDGLWSGQVASSGFNPDNEGWVVNDNKGYGANGCARFGTTSSIGMVTTPSFAVDGEATLTFNAAPWGSDGLELRLSVTGGEISPEEVYMNKGQWTEFTATITAHGPTAITFLPEKRLFLDEVRVVEGIIPSAIRGVAKFSQPTEHSGQGLYDLQGRRVTVTSPGRGIYIMNGKKYIIK